MKICETIHRYIDHGGRALMYDTSIAFEYTKQAVDRSTLGMRVPYAWSDMYGV